MEVGAYRLDFCLRGWMKSEVYKEKVNTRDESVARIVNSAHLIHLPMKMEPIVSSETSAIRTQTPGNYPKRNKLHLEHGESLKTR